VRGRRVHKLGKQEHYLVFYLKIYSVYAVSLAVMADLLDSLQLSAYAAHSALSLLNSTVILISTLLGVSELCAYVNRGDRLKEASSINGSLSTLGQVLPLLD
jgi:hypothetical protein